MGLAIHEHRALAPMAFVRDSAGDSPVDTGPRDGYKADIVPLRSARPLAVLSIMNREIHAPTLRLESAVPRMALP